MEEAREEIQKVTFERPINGDLDRSLSLLMHDAHHKAMEECNRIKSDAIKAGALQSNRVIATVAKAADTLHQDAMKQATPVLLDFIERMQLPPAEVTGWARPHLENLGNTLLGSIPPSGFPSDHQRIVAQYRAVFKQRLDGVLRDVEIGFVKEAGFARAEKVESKEDWIGAADTVQLLKPVMTPYTAQMTICTRAHSGLIRARADRFMTDSKMADNYEVPKAFWWAEGNEALEQNWKTGDFETWIDHRVHLRAFGVSFLRADIEKMIPASKLEAPPAPVAAPPASSAAAGGRPSADWWEDLLIDVCFQHFRGDLQPKKQADIERAMQQWITGHGYNAADSTIRIRARKVWQAIKREGDN
jgi:hypothetical protein